MAEKTTNLDLTPSFNRIKGAGTGALAGIAGGVGVLIGVALLGQVLGPIVGGVITGAIIGGDAGRVISVNGAMDAVIIRASQG